MKRFLETGIIVGTHGVHGEMRVEPWCDSPDFLRGIEHLYFDEGQASIPILSRRVHKSLLLLTVEGVDTVEKAEELRGKVLYLDRNDVTLGQGAFFIQDLIGLHVLDAETGMDYGSITNVFATGANDVYEIQSETGKKYYFPAVKHMIAETTPADGWIKVRPIPGIFDDGGETDAD